MTETILSRAFAPVASLSHAVQDWWTEKTFWFYYYAVACDPSELISKLPLNTVWHSRMRGALDVGRAGLINSAAIKNAASDYDSRPGSGLIVQKLLNPAVEIAMRTNMKSPLIVASLATVGIMALGYYYGWHMQDTAAHVMATVNSESGKINSPVITGADIRKDYVPDYTI